MQPKRLKIWATPTQPGWVFVPAFNSNNVNPQFFTRIENTAHETMNIREKKGFCGKGSPRGNISVLRPSEQTGGVKPRMTPKTSPGTHKETLEEDLWPSDHIPAPAVAARKGE